MIGLLLIYYIGKSFYELAFEFDKKINWVYSILGIASYYLGTMIFAVLLEVIFVSMESHHSVEKINSVLLSLLALPAGILCCWAVYKILKNRWSNSEVRVINPDVLDGELIG